MKTYSMIAAMVLAIWMIPGCGDRAAQTGDGSSQQAAVDGAPYLLDTEPAGATSVLAVRGEAADQDSVVVVGRIGGSVDPWVEGRAAFTIVDQSLSPCGELGEDCGCPTPWDYCCDSDKMASASLLIKFVDKDGSLIKTDAKKLLNVTELQTVVVEGTAQKDDDGKCVVLASRMYVKQ